MASVPANWQHIWVGDDRHGSNWHPVAREHFEALSGAGFTGEVHVGLVGGANEKLAAIRCLDSWWPAWKLGAQAEEGFEMPTLHAMHEWCKNQDPGTPVLYTHTKGAFQAYPGNHKWRKAMTGQLVECWRDRVDDLETYDAAGLHWLTNREYPDKIHQPGIFGGNFWWARAGYIAGLPPISFHTRYCAEGWVGLNSPNVKCLKDGWPQYV